MNQFEQHLSQPNPQRKVSWISTVELGSIWSLSPRTISNYRRRGLFDGLMVKLPGKGWRYHAEAIEVRFLNMDKGL